MDVVTAAAADGVYREEAPDDTLYSLVVEGARPSKDVFQVGVMP